MSRFVSYVTILCLLPAFSIIQAQQLRTSVDWAVFDYDADNVVVEVYYSFLQADLNFQQTDDQLHALTLAQINVLKGDEVLFLNAWKNETTVADSIELQQPKDIVDRIAFQIPSGEYTCRFVLKDLLQPENVDTLTWTLNAAAAKADAPHLSEIQLASSIRRAAADEESSPFYKNSLIVEPNPSLLYSYERPALFFYAEAYQLPVQKLPNGYRLKYYVLNADGNIPDSLSAKVMKKKKVFLSNVEFGMMNVGKLKTGAYTFHVELQNDSLRTLAEKSKKFYVLQKEELQKQQTAMKNSPYESSVFTSMDSTDIEKEFLMVFYLLSTEEQIIHKEIADLEGKRHFLYNFWRNKYPDVNVNENPMRQEYYRRMRAADDRFSTLKMGGWITDRGRVFMVYGEPDDIERHPNEANTYDYEIWFYNSLQSGVRFVFADFEGYRNYRLIHSDLLGEIQDANFRQQLIKAGY